MSQNDFGCIFDGFTMNLRFGIGEKSRGRVEPFFSPVGDRDGLPAHGRAILVSSKNQLISRRYNKSKDFKQNQK